jgi:hypothetical protein
MHGVPVVGVKFHGRVGRASVGWGFGTGGASGRASPAPPTEGTPCVERLLRRAHSKISRSSISS